MVVGTNPGPFTERCHNKRIVSSSSLSLPDMDPVDRQYALLARSAARALVRPVALTLAALYGVFSTAHMILWAGRAGTTMAAWAAVSAVFFLTSALGYDSRLVRRHPHGTLGAFSFVALSNALLHLALRGDPTQTTNVALIFLGVSALIFHTPTFVSVLATGLVAWAGIGAAWSFADPYWIHYGFGMISATIVASLIYQGRNHFVRRAARLEAEGKEREERIRASRRRFEQLFSASPGIICIHDLAGYILNANAAGAAAVGIPRDRLVGMNIGPFLLNNNREVPKEYLETLAREGHASGVITVEGTDGTLRRWKYRSTLFRDPLQEDFVVASALDVTELEEAREDLARAKGVLERTVGERTLALREANRRLEIELEERNRMEEELRQKHKLEALGRLAGGIAHEFNNILTVLTGNLELALDEARSGELPVESLEEVQSATERATNLVSQILAFSRMDQATHTLFDATTFLHETVDSLRANLPPEVEIALHAQGELGRLRGSRSQLRQVLGNLVRNSSQAMEEGGQIRIQASTFRATALESARVDIPEGTHCLRVQVSDNGKGIPYQDQDRVFDPFFGTREVGEGVGLGLSVAHGITRSHGGDIALDSVPGEGTVVTLVFPTVEAAAGGEKDSGPGGLRPEGARVLVVDDEPAIARLVAQSLSKAGLLITSFSDPEEVLTRFKGHPDQADLLVVDLSMPGMRGDELGSAIREIRPGFPILVITGFGDFLDLASFVRQGPTSILPKPFTSEGLLQAVTGLLRDAARSGSGTG